jgi:DinB superfamily
LMNTITAVDAYLAGPKDLRAAVADMSPEQLIARSIPGKWSALEVICHLADTDANIAYRIKRVLAEEQPSFERVKPDQMLAALAYHARDVEVELALIDLTRRQIVRILSNSPPEGWERTGSVNERGVKTVAQMLNGAIEHLAHHRKFIVEKRLALGLAN